MFGWMLLIGCVVVMYKIADAENKSPIIWGAVTFLLCMVAIVTIPLPFINIGIGAILAFAALFVSKAVQR